MAAASCQILFFLVTFFLQSGVDAQSSGQLRLVGRNEVTSSTLTAGRLEVYYNGQWGTVCDDLFGFSEATVACQQLGFSDYVRYGTISTSFRFQTGSSSTPIWLDNLSCSTFSDSRLIDCDHNTIGSTNCQHSEDVYISCEGNGALRIGTSDSSSSGRLEVYFNGQWGTVCDDSFFQTEANVACQQLGYSSASDYGTALSLGYSSGSGQIWLDNVDCSSSDIMLSSCSHNGIGNTNCIHSEDVAVVCSTDISDIIDNISGAISTGVIVGIIIAVLAPCICIGVCIIIVCIAVCTGACAAGASSRRPRNRGAVAATAVASTAAAPPTAIVMTTNTGQAQAPYGGGYPQAPPAYPAKGQPYPEQGAAPPYPTNTAPGYPPPDAYPAQGAYPPYPTNTSPGYPPPDAQGQPYPAQGAAPPHPTNTAPGYPPPDAAQEKPPVELNQYPPDAAYPPPTVP